MENTTAAIKAATIRNILLAIDATSTTRNAIALKAGIPSTTFYRQLEGKTDFTLPQLGAVAEALGKTLGDILPSDLITRQAAA